MIVQCLMLLINNKVHVDMTVLYKLNKISNIVLMNVTIIAIHSHLKILAL